MEAGEWIEAYASELGLEPPSEEQVALILKLAAIGAHSSERKAAPIACYLAGQAGVDLERARQLAQRIGPEVSEEPERPE